MKNILTIENMQFIAQCYTVITLGGIGLMGLTVLNKECKTEDHITEYKKRVKKNRANNKTNNNIQRVRSSIDGNQCSKRGYNNENSKIKEEKSWFIDITPYEVKK